MLTEELMREVRRLEIRARRRVDDLFGGQYHSAFKGQGIEFAEVREYQPGDEVRTIDWNVTARTGLPHIKRFTEERQLTVIMSVDCSLSTAFGSVNRSKHQLACEVGAVLTLAAGRNNDRVGLQVYGSEHLGDMESFHLRPSKGKKHARRILRELIDATPGQSHFNLSDALVELGRTHRRRAILFVMSDFLSGLNNRDEPDWAKPLRMLNQKHEVVAIQLTDPLEFELPKAGMIRMFDPISGKRFSVDTSSRKVRARFKKQATFEQNLITKTLKKARVDRVELSTSRSYVEDLVRYFHKREMQKR
ncbi:MAG: DUF58 domain-containing protein [Phycisphaerales bacterium]|nr:DUF58 domain-containing protein [Phycisphaerales bacterium]